MVQRAAAAADVADDAVGVAIYIFVNETIFDIGSNFYY